MIAILTTLILLAEGPTETAARGTFCVGAPATCQETSGATVTIPAAEEERTFVWRRRDGAEIAVGTVKPNASTVDWPARSVALRVKDQGQTDFPQRIDLLVEGAAGRWAVALNRREASGLARLFLPEGNHGVTATAERRRPARVQISGGRLAYELMLIPKPSISGRVVDQRTRKGIVGALITALPAETAVAVTDYSGQFSFEPDEEWPKALRVSAPAFGTKIVAAPASVTSTLLPWTELSPAGAIALTVRHDEEVEAELARLVEDAEKTAVASKVISPTAGTVQFDGLDEGEYELSLRGKGAFERYTTKLAVKAEQTTNETIELAPVPIDIHVVRETDGVPDVRVQVTHLSPEWKTDATTDSEGHVRGRLWQQGLFVAFVAPPQSGGTQIARKSLSGANEITWVIALHGGTVSGMVVDAREKFPLGRAKVRLETKKAGGMQELTTSTNDRGEFSFEYVPDGTQTLTAHTTGYVMAEETFQLTSAARARRLRVELEPAEVQAVRVVSSYGAPLVGATITDSSGGSHGTWTTDAEGRASVPIRRGEAKTVFVLPREGSFAAATLPASGSGQPRAEQQIVVPKGEVTIDIRTQDGAGNGVPDVELLLRHNGVLIPESVARLMFKLHGNMLRTGRSGAGQLRNLPVGAYEFWPYFTMAEFEQLSRGPQSPGTALVATPGVNSVVMTFERRKIQ